MNNEMTIFCFHRTRLVIFVSFRRFISGGERLRVQETGRVILFAKPCSLLSPNVDDTHLWCPKKKGGRHQLTPKMKLTSHRYAKSQLGRYIASSNLGQHVQTEVLKAIDYM